MAYVDELAGALAWLSEAQRLVDEGVVELERRMADRDEAERAVMATADRDL